MRKPQPSITTLILTASLLALGPRVVGQTDHDSSGEPTLFTPARMSWRDGPASLPRGAQFAVLEGDPTREGPFTMRLKLPNGYRIPPHTHPKTERLTVISGTFRLGMGEKFDAKALRTIPAGSYGFWPTGMKHFVQVEGETVVQLHGMGPWQIVYVNSADDPRRAVQ